MRVITVYQPWAWLMIDAVERCPELVKTIENRVWDTRYRGRLLVHASARIDARAYHDAAALIERHLGVELARKLPPFTRAHALPRGGIIGAVTLVDVRPPTAAPESPWHMLGHYGWVLRDPIRLPFYRVRGQQGLWGSYSISGGEVVPA